MESRSGAAAWHEEHVYFERLLDLLESEVEVFADSAAVIFDPLFGANPQERYRELLHYLGQKSS